MDEEGARGKQQGERYYLPFHHRVIGSRYYGPRQHVWQKRTWRASLSL